MDSLADARTLDRDQRRERDGGEIVSEEIRIGQVWRSNDTRDVMRHKRVVGIDATHAVMQSCTKDGGIVGRGTTRVRLDRFRDTSRGYVLIKQADNG